MKAIDKVKKAVSSISSKAINACSEFDQALNAGKEQFTKQVDMLEAFNQIASLSDSDYALSIKITIDHICYCRSSPNYETFMSLSKLAIELLKSGVDPSDVLEYFDTILYMERGGGTL